MPEASFFNSFYALKKMTFYAVNRFFFFRKYYICSYFCQAMAADVTAIDSFLSVVTAHIYCRNL